MQDYSPFDKAIKELEPPDLTILRNVPEGWYVEYKSQVGNAGKLAKSLSAFANTYGGWLFLGVKEQSKDNAVADEFPGIPEEDVDGTLQRLRQSAAAHLNPDPFPLTSGEADLRDPPTSRKAPSRNMPPSREAPSRETPTSAIPHTKAKPAFRTSPSQ